MKHWRIIHTTLGYTAQNTKKYKYFDPAPLHWSSGERRDCVNVRSGNIWKPLSLPHPEASPFVCIIHNIKTVFQISGFNKRHNIDIRFYHHTNSSKGRSFLSGLNTFWIDTLICLRNSKHYIKQRSFLWMTPYFITIWLMQVSEMRWCWDQYLWCSSGAQGGGRPGQAALILQLPLLPVTASRTSTTEVPLPEPWQERSLPCFSTFTFYCCFLLSYLCVSRFASCSPWQVP